MEPLGPEIRRELRRFGPAAGMADLLAAWPEAVGPGIAQNAWPARFLGDGVLLVHTVDSVWAFELAQRAGEISGRLGKLAPKGLRFHTGPMPDPAAEDAQQARERVREATPEEAQQAAEWAAGIADEELRELVARAARASLARTQSDRHF